MTGWKNKLLWITVLGRHKLLIFLVNKNTQFLQNVIKFYIRDPQKKGEGPYTLNF